MKLVFIFLLCLTQAFAHERELPTKADLLATATFQEQRHHQWPFPLLSIGNSMQSYQDYDGSPYWHDGLDIRSVEGETIHAVVGGQVVNLENYQPGNRLYWEIAILDDEGFIWKYHHVDRKTMPSEIDEAYKNKSRVETGAFLGKVVKWPVTSYGEVYHHLHLQVVAKDKKYINPFLMLEPLPDTSAPVISRIGIAQKHRPIEKDVVSGPHALFVEASDLTLHTKFLLTPYKISYRMDKLDEIVVWEFINLPSGTSDTNYIEDFYMKGTCGDYSCRKFYINLNFTQKEPRKTMTLSPGKHEIDVTVEDTVGNKTSQHYEWKVL